MMAATPSSRSNNVVPLHPSGSALDQALWFARRGFRAFPVAAGAKDPPCIAGWPDKATTDEAQIRAWAEEFPGCNWGIATGRTADGRSILAIDLDHKHGQDGATDLSRLEIEHDFQEVPPTLTQSTPTGGRHLLVYTRKLLGSTAKKVAPGIDTRGEGGYIVAAGSTVPAGTYSLAGEVTAIAQCPPWLEDLAEAAFERDPVADQWLVELDLPANVEYARDFLSRTKPAIQGQGGDNWTYATAAKVRDDFAVSEEKCLELMLEPDGWNARCVPPWLPGELEHPVSNAYRYARRPAGAGVVKRQESVERLVAAAGGQQPAPQDIPAGPSPRLRVLTGDDLDDVPDAAPLIKGVLYAGNLVMLIGEPGRYKSFITLDMAAHLALGLDWAGRKVPAARDVLYVAAEGEAGMKGRRRAWIKHHGGKPDRLRYIAGAPQFGEGGAAHLDECLTWHAARGFRPGVIYLDTLASVTAGLNESSCDMGGVIRDCRTLMHKHGCAIVLVHHTGHGDKTRGRGWSGLEGGIDGSYLIDADIDARTVTVRIGKPLKDFDGQLAPLGFRGTVVKLGEDADGETITSLVFDHDPDAKPPAAETRGKRRKVDPITTELRTRAFLEVIHDIPQRTIPLAEAMAQKMLPNDASDGAALVEQKRIKAWLDNIARGRTDVPDVFACLVPEVRPAEWRRTSDTMQGDAR